MLWVDLKIILILSCNMSQVQGLTLIQGICCGYDLKILLILGCNVSQVQGLTLIQGICCGWPKESPNFKLFLESSISNLFKIVQFVKIAVTNLTIFQANNVRVAAKLLQANTQWVTTALTLSLSVLNCQTPDSAESPYVYFIISDQMYRCTCLECLIGTRMKVLMYLKSCSNVSKSAL